MLVRGFDFLALLRIMDLPRFTRRVMGIGEEKCIVGRVNVVYWAGGGKI